MSRLRVGLRLCAAVAVLAVFTGACSPAHAVKYAVVANSNNGTVSMLRDTGSGWSEVYDAQVTVQGQPWGVATYGNYAYVANRNGSVSVLETRLGSAGEVMLDVVQTIQTPINTQWVAIGSGGNDLYVSALGAQPGPGGSVLHFQRSGGWWQGGSPLSIDSGFLPQGLAAISPGAGSDKVVVAENAIVGTGQQDRSQTFQGGTATNTVSFADGMPAHVAFWVSESKRFAFITRQSQTHQAGWLSSVDIGDTLGMYVDLTTQLDYRPYAIAVVGSNAYVSAYDNEYVYKYGISLTGLGNPALNYVTSIPVGSVGSVRQLAASDDDQYLLVTSNGGSTVHSIRLSDFTATEVGQFAGAVGVGFVTPEASSLAGLAAGLLAMAGGAWRRKGKGRRDTGGR